MEKLAQALYALNPDNQPWDGDPFGFAFALQRGEYHAKQAVRQAEMLIELGVVNVEALETIPSMWDLRRQFPTR